MKILLVITIVMVSAYVSACGDAKSVDNDETQISHYLQNRSEDVCVSEEGFGNSIGDFFLTEGKDKYEGRKIINKELPNNEGFDKEYIMKAIDFFIEDGFLEIIDDDVTLLTEKGERHLYHEEGFCIGEFVFHELDFFTEPVNGGTQVTYYVKYKPTKWVPNMMGESIEMPMIYSLGEPKGSKEAIQKRITALVKTNKGWLVPEGAGFMFD